MIVAAAPIFEFIGDVDAEDNDDDNDMESREGGEGTNSDDGSG